MFWRCLNGGPVQSGLYLNSRRHCPGAYRHRGGHFPETLPNTLQNAGNCYTVVAMLLAGFVIGDYRIKKILGGDWSVYIITAVRLLVISCPFLAVLRYLHAPQMLCVML